MASAAPANPSLPLLYRDLVPLSSVDHAGWHLRTLEALPFMHTEHAIPVTIDEFAVAQRHYPIIFSAGDAPVPLALMGLNEGMNTFFDAEGKVSEPVYIPAYIRRYPFLLAKLRLEAEELSLCVDNSHDVVGKFEDGKALFDGTEASQTTKDILAFCEQFEQAGQRTGAFMDELKANDLLMDGEVSIQTDNDTPPFVYRGFQMVNEEKFRDLRGDVLRKMMQSGLVPLVHAHLFSLSLMRDIFGRQAAQGKMPQLQTAS